MEVRPNMGSIATEQDFNMTLRWWLPNLMMYSSIHLYNLVYMESADTFSTLIQFCAMDFKIIIYVVLLMKGQLNSVSDT